MTTRNVAIRGLATAIAGCLAVSLVACAGSSDPNTTSADGETLQTVTITQAPLTAYAPVWVADEQGYFAEQGIEVEYTDAVQNGSAQIAMIASGQADVVTASTPGMLQAKAEGLETQFIAGLQVFGETDAADNTAIIVPNGSDISRPRDLTGKTVAVVGINSQEDMKLKVAIDADGGDSSSTQFVQATPDAMAGLMQNGDVDAAAPPQPGLGALLATGEYTRIAGANYVALGGTTAFNVVSTPTWLSEHEDLARGLRAAIAQAVEWANDPANKDALDELVARHLDVDVEVIASIDPPDIYGGDWDAEKVARVQDAMVEYGLLDAPVDLDSLVWTG